VNLDFTTDKFVGMYRGQVLDNNDPDKLGRIKVNLFGLTDGIDAEDLPWAVPAYSIFTGSGIGYGFFAVPEIGTHVFVFFEGGGDIYQPVYFLEAVDGIHGLPSERTIDYPYRKVLKTKNGIVIIIDDLSKEIYVNHPSGSYLKIDTAGNIIIQGETVHINPG
jgi:hypothetical protein